MSKHAARVIAALHDARQRFAEATVELGKGTFHGAPPTRVWLVFPPARNYVGGTEAIAICPRTGRVLFSGRIGE